MCFEQTSFREMLKVAPEQEQQENGAKVHQKEIKATTLGKIVDAFVGSPLKFAGSALGSGIDIKKMGNEATQFVIQQLVTSKNMDAHIPVANMQVLREMLRKASEVSFFLFLGCMFCNRNVSTSCIAHRTAKSCHCMIHSRTSHWLWCRWDKTSFLPVRYLLVCVCLSFA
jgi:hypothetical protein